MTTKMFNTRSLMLPLVVISLVLGANSARAEIDGHGPDAWRVTGVTASDHLNARMGPGTNYPVIETFSHNERGMQQITCVPFYTAAHFTAMTQGQIDALPARWCLMRNSAMTKAGWVAQRYITPDQGGEQVIVDTPRPVAVPAPSVAKPTRSAPESITDPLIAQAQDLVRELYERHDLAQLGAARDSLDPAIAGDYFTADIVAMLRSGGFGAHPLYGAQDFDGAINEPTADPDQPMLRGMITINVDFTNFGQWQRAIFYVRGDTERPGAPLRIFRVEHEGWSYP